MRTPTPRPRTLVGALVASAVCTLCAALTAAVVLDPATDRADRAAASVPTPQPGAAGIGDGYFPRDGNGGYDVAHYGIDDTYRMASGRLTGRTVIRAVATERLSSFHLDLVLTPDAVTVDGVRARATKSGLHELVVTPRAPIAAGHRFTVSVRYHGVPRRIRWNGERPWLSNRHEALATNEPHIAPWWFAVNDHPRDKAAYDVTVRVPRGNQVIGNGALVSRHLGGTWSTYHWRMSRPMASYLAFFAAGRFRVERGRSAGLPFTIAVSRRLAPADQRWALKVLRRSAPITAWLATQFGPYPFGSTGGVATSLFSGFALENQSRPTYDFYGLDRTTVVHELAHQWFGDDVSVDRWRDIWLNEGFASFAEWLYSEHHGGYSAQRQLRDTYGVYGAHSPFWTRSVADPGPQHLFSEPVYVRGAMTLQALRHRIGDRDFHTVLRSWVRQHHGSTATIEEFEALAASVSGQQLGGFFDSWLRTPAKPADTAANGLG